MSVRLLLALLALLAAAATTMAQAPAVPAGMTRTPLIDNDTVAVTRVRFAAGAREPVHTHPFALAVVQLTRGEREFAREGTQQRGVVEPGVVEIVGPNVPHAAANPGTTEWEIVAVGGKRAESTVTVASPSMLTPAQPELSIDAVETGARVLIPLNMARLQVQIGSESTTELYVAGEPIFVPGGTTFSLRSTGTAPVTIVSLLVR